jgi:hypothetical protein
MKLWKVHPGGIRDMVDEEEYEPILRKRIHRLLFLLKYRCLFQCRAIAFALNSQGSCGLLPLPMPKVGGGIPRNR